MAKQDKAEKKKFGEKIVNFFSKNKGGKVLGSLLLGIGNAFPLTAPFMPAIKDASAGLAGKDKNDWLAWASFAATLVFLSAGAIMVVKGDNEAGDKLLEIAKMLLLQSE